MNQRIKVDVMRGRGYSGRVTAFIVTCTVCGKTPPFKTKRQAERFQADHFDMHQGRAQPEGKEEQGHQHNIRKGHSRWQRR